ncbi:MAG: tellurium resistance protein TerC [Verrucomicrobiota bacterium JB023]|nr:tellurium resistance protein TerC [Verrucomicrobiota bacterium JB023]
MIIEYVITLLMLVLLQAVLGFDNLLYISLESKRVVPEKQAFVRRMGIGLAVGFRIVLLFIVVALVEKFKDPLFGIHLGSDITPENIHGEEKGGTIKNIIDGEFNFHALIVLFGGVFILYTAVKEIFHMIGEHDFAHGDHQPASVGKTIAMIVIMNVIFSFDSILSAMALARNEETGDPRLILMVIAILIGGGLMIWLADGVSSFLQKNRMYEVLGLFILLVVGIMLLTEGGHLAHLHIAGNEITPMTKTTFYFVIVVLALTDFVQGRYQKQLLAKQEAKLGKAKQVN